MKQKKRTCFIAGTPMQASFLLIFSLSSDRRSRDRHDGGEDDEIEENGERKFAVCRGGLVGANTELNSRICSLLVIMTPKKIKATGRISIIQYSYCGIGSINSNTDTLIT